jgi:two-component system KDP operon response regulator KdpE
MTAGSLPTKVLVVDDEPPIRRFLRTSLTAQGYEVVEADTAKEALGQLARNRVDVLVLDLGLPDMDGIEVLALDLGADDYVTKPFGIDELLARLRGALRHRLQQHGERPVFKSGDLSVDLVRRIVTMRGKELKLTPREYDLLRLLVAHAGKVLTHKFILREIWGADTDVQYLRIYIRTLRHKLEPAPEAPQYILTEQGVGYRLKSQD